jgi:molecular chaperone DnaK
LTQPKDPIVGIDLGTSNSVVAAVAKDGHPVVLPDDQNQKIIPSVVAFHPNGEVIVGRAAKQRRIIDPRNTVYSTKRIIGRRWSAPEVAASAKRSAFQMVEGPNEVPHVKTRAGEFSVPEISGIVLDHMRKIAQARMGTDVRRVVITVPANFSEAQRQATATAGAIAELVVVRILNEPTAAALAYGHGRRLQQTVAVYDFGGGTFDITILALRDNVYEVLATAGDTFLGGDDIDQRLVEVMVNSFLQQNRVDLRYDEIAMQKLRAAAEDAKCALSFDKNTKIDIPEVSIGIGGKPLHLAFTLSRDAFVQATADILDKSFPVCDEAMRLAQLAPTQIDEVVLVGGTTRIPYLREKVAAHFGRQPRVDLNPDEAIALGAALQAQALSNVLDKKRRNTMQGAVPPPVPGGPNDKTLLGVPPTPPVGSLPPPTPGTGIARMPMKQVTVIKQRPPEVSAAAAAQPTQRIMTEEETTRPDARSMPPAPAPVLLDVTPRSLCVATVGGWCEELIARTSPVPTEQTRVFSTAHDNQTAVEVKIGQGESKRFEDNEQLGTVTLEGIPPRPRGQTRISVTFEITTDGILQVSARDDRTGTKQSAQIKLLGGQSPEEIKAAKDRVRSLRER